MHYKTGDKVRFLNEIGNGIVKSVLSNGKILVETEDGFDIPYYASELVLADASQITERKRLEQKPDMKFNNKKWERGDDFKEFTANEILSDDCIYMVFEPLDPSKPCEGNLNFGFINKTLANTIIVIHEQLPDNSYKCIKHVFVSSDSYSVVEEIKRSQINDIPLYRVDILFYNSKAAQLPMPISTLVKVKATRFFKENNFKVFKGFNTRFLSTKIVDLKNAQFLFEEEPYNEIQTPEKRQIDKSLLEVDLHVEKINPDFKNLESSAILALQLSFFRKNLDYAIKEQFKRAVFIHGVGNGVLKTEILKIVKEYADLKARDASFLKYGYGATEVLLDF